MKLVLPLSRALCIFAACFALCPPIRRRRQQMAANILKEMRAAGHPLDTCTLNHALSVLTLAQRTRQAFEFYEAMFQSGTCARMEALFHDTHYLLIANM